MQYLILVPAIKKQLLEHVMRNLRLVLYTIIYGRLGLYTHRSFICVHVTCKHHIDFVLHKPRLEHDSHGLAFHVVIIVAVVPGRVHEDNQPRCLTSVYLRELILKPFILRGVFS